MVFSGFLFFPVFAICFSLFWFLYLIVSFSSKGSAKFSSDAYLSLYDGFWASKRTSAMTLSRKSRIAYDTRKGCDRDLNSIQFANL